jgi:hypothetical protein
MLAGVSMAGGPAPKSCESSIGAGCHILLYAATPDAPVRWRLLSANNREIGRGLLGYPDAESSCIAIKELQRDVAILEPRIKRVEPNRWLWEVYQGRVLVATAGRPFDRLIRCEQSVERFVGQFAYATVTANVIYTAARRWGSVNS